jgi:hypothetical protein
MGNLRAEGWGQSETRLKISGVWVWAGFARLRTGFGVRCCEDGNEPSGCTYGGEFVNKLNSLLAPQPELFGTGSFMKHKFPAFPIYFTRLIFISIIITVSSSLGLTEIKGTKGHYVLKSLENTGPCSGFKLQEAPQSRMRIKCQCQY